MKKLLSIFAVASLAACTSVRETAVTTILENKNNIMLAAAELRAQVCALAPEQRAKLRNEVSADLASNGVAVRVECPGDAEEGNTNVQ